MATKELLNAAQVKSYVKAGGKADPASGVVHTDIWDMASPGLILRIRKPGVGSYSYRYQIKGERRRLTIGRTIDVSLAEARERVDEYRSKVKKGIDPYAEAAALAAAVAEAKAKAEARITFAEAAERFLAHSIRESALKGKVPNERVRLFRVDILPALGTLKLAEVTDDDVMGLIQEAIDEGHERKPSILYEQLSAFLNWCVEKTRPRLLEASPLKSAKPSQNPADDRFLSVKEIEAFLATLPVASMSEDVRDIVRLILRLGQRVGEVCQMRKRDVDLVNDIWTVPGRVAKNSDRHTVPLPPRARRIIIAAMERSSAGWVFPNLAGDGPLDKSVVCRAMARSQGKFGFLDEDGNPNTFNTHALRRTCATYCEKLGASEKVIGRILNHRWIKSKNVTGIYARDDLTDPAFDVLVRWEVALEQIAAGVDPFNVSVADRRQRAAAIRAAMMGDMPALPAPEVIEP